MHLPKKIVFRLVPKETIFFIVLLRHSPENPISVVKIMQYQTMLAIHVKSCHQKVGAFDFKEYG